MRRRFAILDVRHHDICCEKVIITEYWPYLEVEVAAAVAPMISDMNLRTVGSWLILLVSTRFSKQETADLLSWSLSWTRHHLNWSSRSSRRMGLRLGRSGH